MLKHVLHMVILAVFRQQPAIRIPTVGISDQMGHLGGCDFWEPI